MKEKRIISVQRYSSPCGELLLGSIDGRLCMCDWQVEKHSERIAKRLKRLLRAEFCEQASEVTLKAAAQLDEYFAGGRRVFDIPLCFAGSEFQIKVWNELLSIPYGATTSYGELARLLGMPRAVRTVANANGANSMSIFVPCHRVIGSNRSLTGYAGGLDAKRKLLEIEKQ